jgi:G3E family GTPase
LATDAAFPTVVPTAITTKQHETERRRYEEIMPASDITTAKMHDSGDAILRTTTAAIERHPVVTNDRHHGHSHDHHHHSRHHQDAAVTTEMVHVKEDLTVSRNSFCNTCCFRLMAT